MTIIRAFLNSEFFRIIGYGCLLFVAVPCWVGLAANALGFF